MSWLITVGEKVLDGQRLYIDIFEVNPPASVLDLFAGDRRGPSHWSHARVRDSRAGLHPRGDCDRSASGKLVRGRWTSFSRDQGPANARQRPVRVPPASRRLLRPARAYRRADPAPFIAVMAVRVEGATSRSSGRAAGGYRRGRHDRDQAALRDGRCANVLFLMWRRRSIAAGLGVESWAAAAVVAWPTRSRSSLFYPAFLTEALPLLSAVYLPSRNSFAEVWLSPAALMFFLSCGLCALSPPLERLSRSLAAPATARGARVSPRRWACRARAISTMTIRSWRWRSSLSRLILIEPRGDRSEAAVRRVALLAILAGSSALCLRPGPDLSRAGPAGPSGRSTASAHDRRRKQSLGRPSADALGRRRMGRAERGPVGDGRGGRADG